MKNLDWPRFAGALTPIPVEKLTGLGLTQATIDCLSKIGLPEEAAPFLSFVHKNEAAYDTVCPLNQIYPFLDETYAVYVYIGSEGSGCPIVIDTTQNDRVVCLDLIDYENTVGYVALNSSVALMLGYLAAFARFVERIESANGEGAFEDGRYTEEHIETLRQEMVAIEPEGLSEHGFWQIELENLSDCMNTP